MVISRQCTTPNAFLAEGVWRWVASSDGLFRCHFLLLVMLYVVVDVVWKFEIAVEVATIWIIRIRDDGKVLLGLPLKKAIALRRAVVATLNLTEHHLGSVVAEVSILGEPRKDLLVRHEVSGDHREGKATVVADVLSIRK